MPAAYRARRLQVPGVRAARRAGHRPDRGPGEPVCQADPDLVIADRHRHRPGRAV